MLPWHVAREVDRLARGAHARTAWAHHPLCSRYATETFRLGRFVLCRGCAVAALGVAMGLLAGILGAPSWAALPLAAPAVLRLMGWRAPKLATRALPGAALGVAAGALVVGPGAVSGAVAASLAAAFFAHRRLYRPDRSPCIECPERGRAPRCAGFERVLHRERAFARLAERVIDRATRISS